MNKAPAFLFYAQDFLTGVIYLDNEEVGMYIKMLAKQWTDGKIPKKRLGFLIGKEWDELSEELRSKFADKGGHLVNQRLEHERENQRRRAEASRENGKKGGRPPKNKNLKKPKQNPVKSISIENGNGNMKAENEKENENENEAGNENGKGGAGEKRTIDHAGVVGLFNLTCPGLPTVLRVTEQRKAAISERAGEYSLEKIGTVFRAVSRSGFLNGENDRGWRADFDWVMKPGNFIKILEGKYQSAHGNGNGNIEGSDGRIKRSVNDAVDSMFGG